MELYELGPANATSGIDSSSISFKSGSDGVDTAGALNIGVISLKLLELMRDVKTLTHKHIEEDPVLSNIPKETISSILQDLDSKVFNL